MRRYWTEDIEFLRHGEPNIREISMRKIADERVGRHLLFVCLPADGHVNPTLPFAAELVRRGHRVTYATSDRFAAAVTATGAEFLPIGFALPPGTPTADSGPTRYVERMRLYADLVENGYQALYQWAVAHGPDSVCYDMSTPPGRMIAERLGLPGIRMLPTIAGNEHTRAQFQAAGMSGPERAALRPVWRDMRRLAMQHGVNTAAVMMAEPTPGLNIVFLPRAFQPAGETFADDFVFAGPSAMPAGTDDGWQPPPGEAPLVLVALGTASNRPEVYRAALGAFGTADWRVVLAVGEHLDVAALGPIPEGVVVAPVVPQPAVLRHADVFVSHGGMNSVMESLLAVVPTVVVPERPEQKANAARVAELGLGRRLTAGELSASALRDAATALLGDSPERAAVRGFRDRHLRGDGAIVAADAAEAFLARRAVAV
ncbi:macrolide family glycosyltransferase [Micromonospora sp. RP3T]|uniref:macrolide family glycosyltransferase n=1 Tax=Micromonospora sp. RP3T TaxID=2135446 RepID=UPI000D177946|nr:macrolide family glycosyltransferase [Micromonospora sp. RP3T]PTA46440.1 hypothetical protein C8054_10295 [Micromonospora sp. RP3T]